MFTRYPELVDTFLFRHEAQYTRSVLFALYGQLWLTVYGWGLCGSDNTALDLSFEYCHRDLKNINNRGWKGNFISIFNVGLQ